MHAVSPHESNEPLVINFRPRDAEKSTVECDAPGGIITTAIFAVDHWNPWLSQQISWLSEVFRGFSRFFGVLAWVPTIFGSVLCLQKVEGAVLRRLEPQIKTRKPLKKPRKTLKNPEKPWKNPKNPEKPRKALKNPEKLWKAVKSSGLAGFSAIYSKNCRDNNACPRIRAFLGITWMKIDDQGLIGLVRRYCMQGGVGLRVAC
jgi:hypothetical protein